MLTRSVDRNWMLRRCTWHSVIELLPPHVHNRFVTRRHLSERFRQTTKYISIGPQRLWPVEGIFQPFMDTLGPQINGPLYSNTMIGTLAVDEWAVTFGTAKRGLGGLWPRPVPSSLYRMSQPTHQRPVYKLHTIRCDTVIASASQRVKLAKAGIVFNLSIYLFCRVSKLSSEQ